MQYQSFKNTSNKLRTLFEKQKELESFNINESLINTEILVNKIKQNKKTQFISNIYNIETSWTDLTYASTLKGTQFFQTSFQNLPLNVILSIKSDIIHQIGVDGLVVDTIPSLYSESGFRKSSFIQLTEIENSELYNVILNNWVYLDNILDSNPLPPYQVKLIIQVFVPVEYL